MGLLIDRSDLHNCRYEDEPAPEPADGQALLRVARFGLTSNNITYAAFGERMSYWDFFPAPPGWGAMPVWGFAEVAASRADGVPQGMRLYGYLPPSTHLIVSPSRSSARGFLDAAPHRAALPAAYNGYTSVEHDPVYREDTEELQMLLRPLFFTSFLIDDFLADADFFGASAIVLSSASSKTASALAYLLAARGGPDVIGLTSERGVAFTRSLGVYDAVLDYSQSELLPDGAAVYVDMAGDSAVRAAVHGRYGEQLAHSAVVGATHHDQMGAVPEDLPGPRPTFFFAPDRVATRRREWGSEGLERAIADAWQPYADWAAGWMRIERASGREALRSAYLDLLDGRTDPACGYALEL